MSNVTIFYSKSSSVFFPTLPLGLAFLVATAFGVLTFELGLDIRLSFLINDGTRPGGALID